MKTGNAWILLCWLCTVGTGTAQQLPDDFVDDGGSVYQVSNTFSTSDDLWTQDQLIWDNAPSVIGEPLSSFGRVTTGSSITIDVSAAVKSDGTYSFAIQNESNDVVIYSSNESPNPPHLHLDLGEGAASENHPTISSFSPISAPPGTEIEVRGTNLAETIQVSLNGISAEDFTPYHDRVLVRIPRGATSGMITVVTLDGSAVSADSFLVEVESDPAPVVMRFEPLSGIAGTNVTVFGKHFENAQEVLFNGTVASGFNVESDTILVAAFPVGAGSGKVSVSNAFGTGASSLLFKVLSGEIKLLNFHPKADAFVWSKKPDSSRGEGTESRVRKSSERQHAYLKFDVSGVTGRVTGAVLYLYTSDGSDDGGQIHTASNDYADNSGPWQETGLTWKNAPVIEDGPVDRLGQVSANDVVEFNVTSAVSGNGLITFAIRNASSDLVSYQAKEGENPPALVVKMETDPLSSPEPTLTGFTPASGPIGTQVTVLGRNLAKTSEIRFGELRAANFSVNSDTTLFVEVPKGAATSKIRLVTSVGATETHLSFEVTTRLQERPIIARFSPSEGKTGEDVTIFGRYFTEATSVNFGYRDAVEFSVDSDTLIFTSVPKTAGTGKLWVTTPNGATQTHAEFRVVSEYGGSVYAIRPSDDTFVRASKPSANYHDWTELRVRETQSGSQIAFLKFPATPILGPAVEASLRMQAMDRGDAGGTAFNVSNNYDNTTVAWDEVGINWSNAPRLAGPALSSVGSVLRDEIVEFNVLPGIVGDGPYSFAVTNSSPDVVQYSSKEGSFPPELIVKTGVQLSATGASIQSIDPVDRPVPLPNRLTLGRNYPNPFNLETTIEYSLPKPAEVQVRIFNVRGREVRRLVDEYQSPGFKLVRWDGLSDVGVEVASGVYVILLRASAETIRDKMIVQK